jgi:excisionase family DNA binding protein
MTVHSGSDMDGSSGELADMNSSEHQSDGKWLSIHDACRLLGVDQSTLRRWSDSGKVPVFRTPGGHRRYSESALQAMVGNGSRRFERQKIATRQLADQSRAGFVDEFWRTARERRWYRAYSTTQLDDLRRIGRHLIELAVRYAQTAVGPERSSLVDEGRHIGTQYGRVSSIAGLSSSEAVEAFLYFRTPVVHSLSSMSDGGRMGAQAMLQIASEVNSFLDQVLLAMVKEHEDRAPFANGPIIPIEPDPQILSDQ